jgi:hypothetical protein
MKRTDISEVHKCQCINKKYSIFNPTGGRIRYDLKGSGYYHAPRGDREHQGVDYICEPGQSVFMPVTGKITRIAYPYSYNKRFSGVHVVGSWIELQMFYLRPDESLIGQIIEAGKIIGIAQDISKKYGDKMDPHIHLQIVSINPEIFVRSM